MTSLRSAVAVIALLAAACSGDGDTTEAANPDEGAAASVTSPATTGDPAASADDGRPPSDAPGDTGANTTTGDDTGTGAGTGEDGAPSIPTVAGATPSAPGTSADEPEAEPAPDERSLPTSADGLAAELEEAELALRSSGIDEAGAAPWGRRQQALYRVLALNPVWAEVVLAGVDASVRDAIAHNWTARQELLALVNTEELSETLPAWRIGRPRPADELLGYYHEAEAATGVPWEILASINLVETRMGRIRGVSTAGAVGPMQFLPTTWAECCDGDPTDPRNAINGAARYLVQRGADTDLDRAVFGYNNSDYYVTAVRSYAAVMEADEAAYYGYHAWQVYFLSTAGLIVLPEGYDQAEPIEAIDYLADHPEALFAGGE